MFDIEISRTYLFSGIVYVSVYVTASVTMIWYLRRFLCTHNLKKFILEVESNQVQNGTRGWHEVYIRLHQQYQY